MRKAMVMAMTVAVLSAGMAGAQTGQKIDPNAWKKPWVGYMGAGQIKWQLDGCYRAQDQMAVCTFTVSNAGTDQSYELHMGGARMVDKANRTIRPTWMAVGASGKRETIDPMLFDDYYHTDVAIVPKQATKISFGYPLAPQYDSVLVVGVETGHDLPNVPIAPMGKTAASNMPTTATIPGYTVTFTSCSVNADSTLNCTANLKKTK